MKGKRLRKQMLGLVVYVCLSAAGLTLIKSGLARNFSLGLNSQGFSLKFSWILVLGMCVYILSFLISLAIMKDMNLSVYYPVSAGLIYVMVCLLSVAIFSEKITIQQLIGMISIFIGIIVMNIGKGN